MFKDDAMILSLLVSLGVSICLDVVSIETLDLDTEKKSVSTRWTFSISISIGLERRDPQAYLLVLGPTK